MNQPDRPTILFLFSDTGGGHRSAAEAIIEAIHLEFPGKMNTRMVDLFKEYAPPPLDLAPEIYPPLSKMPQVWGMGYKISDGRRRTQLLNNILYPYIQKSIAKLIKDNPSDLVVSVHQLMNSPVARILNPMKIPFVTVVTDLITTHAAWYDKLAERIILPTEQAYQRGLRLGIDPKRMKVIGLPVAESFRLPPKDKKELREVLGWPLDAFIVLLIGGGEGMGPIETTAKAIDQHCPEVSLVIITGRNKSLKEKLDKHTWKNPPRIYGFVKQIPDFMRASDVLATKAGPGTISEAFICGLPIILYSYMPGQEDGNIDYVVREGAGYWAPETKEIVKVLKGWTANPESLQNARDACRKMARPDAARQIAVELASLIKDATDS